MMAKEGSDGNRGSFVALIAWLSTCLLAGGLGTMIDPSTHILWLRAGCFGLVAAVGLEAAARLRVKRRRLRHYRTLQRRCDRSLKLFATERENTDALRTATAHLLKAHPQSAREGLTADDSRWACNLPVEVFPIRHEDSADTVETEVVGVSGRLLNLSNSGFGMMLDEEMATRLGIIAMLPPNEQEFDLLAEILWCDRCPDGMMRVGGRLLRVLSSGSNRPLDGGSTDTETVPAGAEC